MLMAQENETTQTETTETYQEEEETTDPTVLEDESQIESTSFHAALKQKIHRGRCCLHEFRYLVFDLRFGYRYRKSYLLELGFYQHKEINCKC